ncbi:MAG: hypothetical protein PHQ46_12335 [Negativicutes bacterium]|nr:hypothetical protein [Negativicutes bacterium]
MAQERTLIAHFPSSTKAEVVVNALYSKGIKDVHVKRNSRFGVSLDATRNDSLASNYAETLTGLTVFSADTPNDENNSARVLMGSDPSVSGFSSRGYGMAGGHAFTLVAFVPEEKAEEVEALIKQAGGEI